MSQDVDRGPLLYGIMSSHIPKRAQGKYRAGVTPRTLTPPSPLRFTKSDGTSCECVCPNEDEQCTDEKRDWGDADDETVVKPTIPPSSSASASASTSGSGSTSGSTSESEASSGSTGSTSPGPTAAPPSDYVRLYDDPLAGKLPSEGFESESQTVDGCGYHECYDDDMYHIGMRCVSSGKLYEADGDGMGNLKDKGGKDIGDCGGNTVKWYSKKDVTDAYKDTGGLVVMVYQPYDKNFKTRDEYWEQEKQLVAKETQSANIMNVIRTEDISVVQGVTVGGASNPTNVKRVEKTVTQKHFNEMFPLRHKAYTYENLLKSVALFPGFCGDYPSPTDSDEMCQRLMAMIFAHMSQETGGNLGAGAVSYNTADADHKHESTKEIYGADFVITERCHQGLWWVRESGAAESGGYIEDGTVLSWYYRASKNVSYYGRGAKQLSYQYNYGLFGNIALHNMYKALQWEVDSLAMEWWNFASALFFAMAPQSPKPPMIWVMDGTWVPNDKDTGCGLARGFASSTMIINGGIECGSTAGDWGSSAQKNRGECFEKFMKEEFKLALLPGEKTTCSHMTCSAWPLESSAVAPSYWDAHWTKEQECYGVGYQTAHPMYIPGSFSRCADGTRRSFMVRDGVILARNMKTTF